ncbi:MAG TPA: hypothetical protein VN862_04660 [Candidatus Acidoferrales bacterium]|nr:hypothetical protein [Candidatus Acidoferrales bacterium]
MNHNVPSGRYLRAIQPYDFADAPANPVAHHGAAHCFFHAEAEAATRYTIRAEKYYKLLAGAATPFAVNGLEVTPANEPQISRPPPRRTRRGVESSFIILV